MQEADAVFRDEIAKSGIEDQLSQFFAVLPDVQTVGVMGDHRTYDHLIAIRAITTDDFMTADWAKDSLMTFFPAFQTGLQTKLTTLTE